VEVFGDVGSSGNGNEFGVFFQAVQTRRGYIFQNNAKKYFISMSRNIHTTSIVFPSNLKSNSWWYENPHPFLLRINVPYMPLRIQ
jgi:hypothetical protein